MSKMTILAVALSMGCCPASAWAATAHNSQAGAYGGTKNNCAATAYFPEGLPDSHISKMLIIFNGLVFRSKTANSLILLNIRKDV